jgi:hypothetical protein
VLNHSGFHPQHESKENRSKLLSHEAVDDEIDGGVDDEWEGGEDFNVGGFPGPWLVPKEEPGHEPIE